MIVYVAEVCLSVMWQTGYPRYSGENLERNKLHYSRLAEFAARHACTVSQLALAWLFHQGNDIVPIPGKILLNLDMYIYILNYKKMHLFYECTFNQWIEMGNM